MAQEVARDPRQILLFIPIYGGLRGLDGAGGASFHFHKAENVAIPADQVEFSAMMRGAVVAGDHGVAAAAEVEVGSLPRLDGLF